MMKTRQPLHQIQKLNLWGNDLNDVSVIKNLNNLEVLALTVNQISTLKDF
jgi:cilla- and flagella-associated protein